MPRPKSILFLTPYPHGEAPSQRFRFEQYLNLLDKNAFKYALKPFLNLRAWRIFYSGKKSLIVFYLAIGIIKRLGMLFTLFKYDIVFIHRETAPFGPPIFEWIIAKVFRKEIIYDFDDAIWLEDPNEKGSLLARIKFKSKISKICRLSSKVSVGNEWLAQYARQFNKNVIINPTTIDTEFLHTPSQTRKREGKQVTIGWTGTHSTLSYLKFVTPIIKKLEAKYSFQFLVIANYDPSIPLKSFRFIKWSKSTEVEDLSQIDIGIMPLTFDPWSKGKCGFKALQYMALEIPAIASPIGVNSQIIDHNVNGYLAESSEEWEKYLEQLLKNEAQRIELGKSGREKVIGKYSVISNSDNFLSLFS